MGRPNQPYFVNNTAVATAASPISTAQPSPTIINQGWPVGDVTYHELCLRISGNLNLATASAGTVTANGILIATKQVWFSTDKHNFIVEGLDGIELNVLERYMGQAAPLVSDPSAATTGTPTYNASVRIPFADRFAARPEDTCLDLYNAKPTLLTQYGLPTDLIAGGTYSTETIQVLNQETHVYMDPGPIDAASDGPLAMPHYGRVTFSVSGTVKQQQIILPFGDRNVKKLIVEQRNSSTGAVLANSIIGVNDLDRLSVKVNGFPWVNNIEWLALQAENAATYQFSAVPSGTACLDFTRRRATGAKLSNALSVVSPNATGTIEMDADLTTGTNFQLAVIIQSVKPLPPAALRPGPTK